MGLILVLLILALLFGGLGFAAHVLWWIAVILAVAFLVGWGLRAGRSR